MFWISMLTTYTLDMFLETWISSSCFYRYCSYTWKSTCVLQKKCSLWPPACGILSTCFSATHNQHATINAQCTTNTANTINQVRPTTYTPQPTWWTNSVARNNLWPVSAPWGAGPRMLPGQSPSRDPQGQPKLLVFQRSFIMVYAWHRSALLHQTNVFVRSGGLMATKPMYL